MAFTKPWGPKAFGGHDQVFYLEEYKMWGPIMHHPVEVTVNYIMAWKGAKLYKRQRTKIWLKQRTPFFKRISANYGTD